MIDLGKSAPTIGEDNVMQGRLAQPVEHPTQFDFVINMKTAKSLGITIPNSVLVRADRVIE
jgi:putative ABC transport system substrate-binding protein